MTHDTTIWLKLVWNQGNCHFSGFRCFHFHSVLMYFAYLISRGLNKPLGLKVRSHLSHSLFYEEPSSSITLEQIIFSFWWAVGVYILPIVYKADTCLCSETEAINTNSHCIVYSRSTPPDLQKLPQSIKNLIIGTFVVLINYDYISCLSY